MKKNMLLGLVGGLWALAAWTIPAEAGAADYAREKKWADEVVPGLVVGGPVYCKPRAGTAARWSRRRRTF